jgi:hypothetical protein
MNQDNRRGSRGRKISNLRWLSAVALLAGAQGANACSVLLNDDATQCTVDADCSKLGFSASHCDTSARVCVADSKGSGGAMSGGGGGVAAMSGTTGGASAHGGASQTQGGTADAGQGGIDAGGNGAGGEPVGGAGGAGGGDQGGAPPDCGDSCGEPLALRVLGATPSKQIGAALPGIDHSDICPNDQVLVGFRFFLGTRTGYEFFQRAQAICGSFSLKGPAPYTVEIDDGPMLRLRGGGFADDEKLERVCPKNQVVIGYSGYAHSKGAQATQLRCAPLTIDGTSEDYSVSVSDEVTELDWAGPTTSGTAVPVTDCPAGQVARGATMRVDSAISRLGISCASPTLAFPDGAACSDASTCASVRCERGYCRTSICDAPSGCTCAAFDVKPFAFCSTPVSYFTGQRTCEQTAMGLANVESEAENGWVRSTATLTGLGSALLGGNDIGIEGHWVWPDSAATQFWQGAAAVSGGMPVSGRFNAWGTAEPNASSTDIDCVASTIDDRWVAQNCDAPAQFVCSAQ